MAIKGVALCSVALALAIAPVSHCVEPPAPACRLQDSADGRQEDDADGRQEDDALSAFQRSSVAGESPVHLHRCAPPGSPVQKHGRLRVQGSVIVDEQGEPVQLKGNSLFFSQWKGQYWNGDVVQWLSTDWHSEVIRAPMGTDRGGYLFDPDGQYKLVKQVVQGAIASGVYVVVDWHDSFANKNADKAAEFFKKVAKKFGSSPNVLYETFNEPALELDWSSQIKPYHERIVKVIRQYSNSLIILGTPTWSHDPKQAADDPVQGENLAYTLHFYAATQKEETRANAQAALEKGVALFVTEWGTCNDLGGEPLDLDSARTWLDWLKQRGISNANWAVDDKNETASALIYGSSASGGWPEGNLTKSGTFVRNYLRGVSWSDMKVCIGRGGCHCDCTWTIQYGCGADDGSCCHGCCCNLP